MNEIIQGLGPDHDEQVLAMYLAMKEAEVAVAKTLQYPSLNALIFAAGAFMADALSAIESGPIRKQARRNTNKIIDELIIKNLQNKPCFAKTINLGAIKP